MDNPEGSLAELKEGDYPSSNNSLDQRVGHQGCVMVALRLRNVSVQLRYTFEM